CFSPFRHGKNRLLLPSGKLYGITITVQYWIRWKLRAAHYRIFPTLGYVRTCWGSRLLTHVPIHPILRRISPFVIEGLNETQFKLRRINIMKPRCYLVVANAPDSLKLREANALFNKYIGDRKRGHCVYHVHFMDRPGGVAFFAIENEEQKENLKHDL